MKNLKKGLSLLICAVFILSLLAGPALAKGGRSFSGGGRSSFSSGAKGYSSGGSFSTSQSSPSGISGGGSSSGKSTVSAPESPAGGGTGSFGKGYGTEKDSFSTPRQGNPPALYSDYSTGKQGYSTGSNSYSTGTGSYSGSWNRDAYASSGADKFTSRPPVGVFGSPPQPPYYYHNNYWSMPLLARMFFQPNYYWTPWGYHFFAPRLLTWIIAMFLIGAAVILIKNKIRGSTY